MYKFTNGLVVFDEKTRDAYVKAGYKLDIKSEKIESQNIPAGLIEFEKNEEINESNSDDGIIKTKPRRSKKVSK